MIRGVLFDMDGVLVNNTQAHVKAFEIFCERYGVEDWQHKLQSAFGMGNDDIMRLILPEEIIREKGMKALGEEKEAIYREVYAPEIRPVRGLVELLEELRRRGIRCAVGSSGCRENVDFVLSNCGITDYFSCIVSGDRVTRCKPDPEIYLLAAEGLHLPSAECLVFEDARVGITAARRAGAGRIVALATTLPRHTLVTQTEADVVIDDFASITDLNTLLLYAMYEKDKILNSFPPDLAKDVRRVLDMLVMKNDDISSRYYIVNLGGLNIAIPERVYMREQTPSNMTAVQRNILDCIFTRHNNGFVRQRHLQNLISCTEYWTIPFCFKLLGEYVDNILYDVKKHLECNMDSYLRFIGENEKFFNRTKNQMISYWNCYYRSRFPNKELYIGFNIFNNLEMAYNNRLNLP